MGDMPDEVRTNPQKALWTYEWSAKPSTPGWYPVAICWEPEEGRLRQGVEWNGSKWLHPAVMGFINQRFDHERSAKDFAYAHDPEESAWQSD